MLKSLGLEDPDRTFTTIASSELGDLELRLSKIANCQSDRSCL